MNDRIGEGARSDLDMSAFLKPHAPTYELLDPKIAPDELLTGVRVNTEGRCLEADTEIGTIAVEMYWRMNEHDPDEDRGDFFAALAADLDPDAADNPIPTQQYPYTIL